MRELHLNEIRGFSASETVTYCLGHTVLHLFRVIKLLCIFSQPSQHITLPEQSKNNTFYPAEPFSAQTMSESV